MELDGWKCVKTVEKSVTFSFGVVRFRHRVYVKNGIDRYPVDEELGIVKRGRYSPELIYEIANYSTSMTLRSVSEKFEVSFQSFIGKTTAWKVTKKASIKY